MPNSQQIGLNPRSGPPKSIFAWIKSRGLTRLKGSARPSASRSLIWHLSVAALSVALPLIVVTTILMAWLAHSEREVKRTALVGGAHALADAVSSQIGTYFMLSKAFSHSVLLLRGDLEAFERQSKDILAGLPGVTLNVYSADGRLMLGVPKLPDDPLVRSQLVDIVRREVESKVASLSDVIPAVPLQRPHASIERLVLDEGGQPLFEIELLFDLDKFTELAERQGYPDGWLVGIVDRNGNFVARVPSREGVVGSPASAEFRAAALWPPRSVTAHSSIDGRQIESAYASIPEGWTVGVAADAGGFQVGPSVVILSASLAAAAIALSFFLSMLTGRRFAKSINMLRIDAEQLSAGKAVAPTATGVRELDALSGALVEASKLLRTRADQQKRAEDELRFSEEHFRLLADSVPQLVWTARPDGRIDYANARHENYGSGGVSRTDWETIIHPDDRRATAEAWLRSSETCEPYEKEHRLLVAAKGYRWHLSRAAPLLDEKGAVARWYGTTTDIDDNKLREEKIRSLMAEVNHRSRNLLAVAQSIARQSVKEGESAQDFERRYSWRLLALVSNQKLLSNHQWSGVALHELISSQTGQFQVSIGNRVKSDGPPIMVNPSSAQTLGLALHELFRNAVKYGALSNDVGEVALTWRIAQDDHAATFEIEWRETGGPPIRETPRSGFGSVLIVKMVAQGMNASANLEFNNNGVIWRVSAPLSEIVIADG